MKIIKFTIKGNQENPQGNPIPYFRTTQNTQWTDGAKRYQQWKSTVVKNFIDALEKMEKKERQELAEIIDLAKIKPIVKGKGKIHMRVCITWANNAHGDCDNIFKGIADALFVDDKYLSGEFDYHYGDAGKVDVTITFYELGKSKAK